jgi:hypothetical protein
MNNKILEIIQVHWIDGGDVRLKKRIGNNDPVLKGNGAGAVF